MTTKDISELWEFERLIWEEVERTILGEGLSSDKASELYTLVFRELSKDFEESLLKNLRGSAPKMLAEDRADRKGFEDRTFLRWKRSFDHLEMIWKIAQEVGETHAREPLGQFDDLHPTVHEVLGQIFPKCLLVAQEIICLLKGGFPDGAMTRWRSLHELTVTSMFIAANGEAAAKAYLLSSAFSNRRAAKQLNEHSSRLGITPYSSQELLEFDMRCAEAEKELGRVIKNDREGEWPNITGSHSTFDSIEKSVGMDHWRPYFKWASRHVHASHRLPDQILGLSEADAPIHLVGASNSGFVDPMQFTALTLTNATSTFILTRPNSDKIICVQVLEKLSRELAHIALKDEAESMEKFKGQA